MATTGPGDRATASATGLHAWEGAAHMVMAADQPFARASVGFVGASDGEDAAEARRSARRLHDQRRQDRQRRAHGRTRARPRPAVSAPTTWCWASEPPAPRASAAAKGALARGYAKVRADYEAGWAAYLGGLKDLPRLAGASGDGGKLLYASAMVLKAQEDKTHPGALIASPLKPMGERRARRRGDNRLQSGVAARFLPGDVRAPGDGATRKPPYGRLTTCAPCRCCAGTPGNRGATGWFLQKTHVDGTPEWKGVQMDQTAMPIMLGDRLWRMGLVSDAHITDLYRTSLKPAADFLVAGGHVDFMGQAADITPPLHAHGTVGGAGRLLTLDRRRGDHRPGGRRRPRRPCRGRGGRRPLPRRRG